METMNLDLDLKVFVVCPVAFPVGCCGLPRVSFATPTYKGRSTLVSIESKMVARWRQ